MGPSNFGCILSEIGGVFADAPVNTPLLACLR